MVAPKTEPVQSATPKLSLTKSGAEVNLYGYLRADASYQAKGASTMYNNISGVPLEGTAEEAQQKIACIPLQMFLGSVLILKHRLLWVMSVEN